MTGISAYERIARADLERAPLGPHTVQFNGTLVQQLLHDIDMWRRIGGREIDLIEPQEIVLTDKTDEQIMAEIARLMSENAMLLDVVREDIGKWSFDALVMMAKRMLDEVYPDDIFVRPPDDMLVRDMVKNDKGPVFVFLLRTLIADIDGRVPK